MSTTCNGQDVKTKIDTHIPLWTPCLISVNVQKRFIQKCLMDVFICGKLIAC